MSRDGGFSRADLDTSLMADPKMVALARRHRDPQRTAVAGCLFAGLILASWKAGERVTLEDSLPAWYLEPVDAIAADLAAVGLVDGDGRILEHAWTSWYEPARERRAMTLDRNKRANDNRRTRAQRGDTAVTALSPRGDIGDRTNRTGPTGQVRSLGDADASPGVSRKRANGTAYGVPSGIEVDRA